MQSQANEKTTKNRKEGRGRGKGACRNEVERNEIFALLAAKRDGNWCMVMSGLFVQWLLFSALMQN